MEKNKEGRRAKKVCAIGSRREIDVWEGYQV